VHPASTVCHRWRLARLPVPCSRSATFRPVHIQEHGVDSPFSFASHPLHIADNDLSAFVNVDVFDRHFLLPFAAMAVRCFEQGGIRAGKLIGLIQILFAAFKRLLGKALALESGIIFQRLAVLSALLDIIVSRSI
jgi:hypothetical protein